MPSMIYITASSPGLLLANGAILGAIDERPIAIRPKEDGTAYLQFFPYGIERIPSTVALSMEKDGPNAAGAILRLWPSGQLELRFEPEEDAPAYGGEIDIRHARARSLLTFLRDGRRGSALATMSRGLTESMQYPVLKNFIGKFDGVEEAKFVPSGSEGVSMATFSQAGTLRKMRLFSFEFVEENGDILIDNIKAFVN